MKTQDLSKLSSKELMALQSNVSQVLNQKIKEDRKVALQNIKQMVTEHDLEPETVIQFLSKRSYKMSKGEARYKDPETGKTWTGKGRMPNWLRDRDPAEFAI